MVQPTAFVAVGFFLGCCAVGAARALCTFSAQAWHNCCRIALQARIDQAQALFREWTQLLPRLQEAQADWQRGEQIMRALADFYFNGDYMRGVNAMEGGARLRLETPGEYSVMAEDTLWNALHEQQYFTIPLHN